MHAAALPLLINASGAPNSKVLLVLLWRAESEPLVRVVEETNDEIVRATL